MSNLLALEAALMAMDQENPPTPDTLASIFCWYAAWKETAYSGGDPVNTMTDSSGNGHNLDGTGHAPTWEDNEINGLPAYALDGTQYTESASKAPWKFLNDTTNSFVSIVYNVTGANPDTFQALFANAATSDEVGYGVYYDDRTSSSANDRFIILVLKGVSGQTGITTISDNGDMPTQVDGIISADHVDSRAGDDMEGYIDGVLEASSDRVTALSSAGPTNLMNVGRYPGGSFYFTGIIPDIVALNNPSAADIAAVLAYQSDKYGISVP